MHPRLSPDGDSSDSIGESDPRYHAALDEVVERYRRGEPIDEETIRCDYPEFAEALGSRLPALRLLAGQMSPGRGVGNRPNPEILPSPSPLHEEFVLLGPIGRGGMGIVYEARQASNDRRVALKFLPPGLEADDGHRSRIFREADAASRLNHENIVPVIAVNIASGTTPYYAMKFIAGHSLAEVLRRTRRRTGHDRGQEEPEGTAPTTLDDLVARLADDEFAPERPGTQPGDEGAAPVRLGRPYFNAVARLGIQAAWALHHAHREGVVHGDVKPGNLLLDHRGRLWLADFGLAVLKGRDAARPIGIAGGTVGYMSPEQVFPDRLAGDHRADVYSLGVTLYELATLVRPPPISEWPPQAVAIPPRRLNPSLPRDLETIVLKAMEPEASRRYASADQLADDLGRFLRREPIRALPASLGDRAGKWAARHRKALIAWGATVAMLLVAMIAFLAAANRREAAQRFRAEQATRGEAAQRVRAEQAARGELAQRLRAEEAARGEMAQRLRAESHAGAMRDLSRHATLAAEDLTEAVPLGSERLHGYYGRMREFYERALERIPEALGDPEFRYRVALANYHLAISCSSREAEPKVEARRYIDRSIEMLRSLVREQPDQQWYRYNLFRSLKGRSEVLFSLAVALADPSWAGQAEADARESLGVIEDLSGDHPENADWEDAVAFQHFMLAQYLTSRGQLVEAEDHAKKTLAIARRLADAYPEKPVYINNVHRAWSILAAIAEREGRRDIAEAALREAITVHEDLSRRGPDQTFYPYERVELRRRLAVIIRDSRRNDEARPILEECLSTIDGLLRAYPYRIDYRGSAIAVRRDLAALHRLAGREDAADELTRECDRISGGALPPDRSRDRRSTEGPPGPGQSPRP